MTDAVHAEETLKTKSISVQEWLSAYDEQPVEVVDGELIPMTPAKRKHNLRANRLSRHLNDFAQEKRLGEALVEAPFVLDGNKREDWVRFSRIPDVAFIIQERFDAHEALYIEEDDPWWLAPDLAVEIISPTDKYTDVMQKVADYLRFGVRLVWLFDPQSHTVRVFTPDNPNGYLLHEHETLSGDPVLPGWSMAVQTLFDT